MMNDTLGENDFARNRTFWTHILVGVNSIDFCGVRGRDNTLTGGLDHHRYTNDEP